MTVSSLRVAKSETRDMAERDRLWHARGFTEPTEWKMTNTRFFVAFIAIAAVLTIAALVLR